MEKPGQCVNLFNVQNKRHQNNVVLVSLLLTLSNFYRGVAFIFEFEQVNAGQKQDP